MLQHGNLKKTYIKDQFGKNIYTFDRRNQWEQVDRDDQCWIIFRITNGLTKYTCMAQFLWFEWFYSVSAFCTGGVRWSYLARFSINFWPHSSFIHLMLNGHRVTYWVRVHSRVCWLKSVFTASSVRNCRSLCPIRAYMSLGPWVVAGDVALGGVVMVFVGRSCCVVGFDVVFF